MSKWRETIKRISKMNPGKSLKFLIPLAKAEYKKMGYSSTKKGKKSCKPSRSRPSTRGVRKPRRGRRGRGRKASKKMKGGDSQNFDHEDGQIIDRHQGPGQPPPHPLFNMGTVDSVDNAPHANITDILMEGGRHCNTKHRKKKPKRRRATRRPKPRRRRR